MKYIDNLKMPSVDNPGAFLERYAKAIKDSRPVVLTSLRQGTERMLNAYRAQAAKLYIELNKKVYSFSGWLKKRAAVKKARIELSRLYGNLKAWWHKSVLEYGAS